MDSSDLQRLFEGYMDCFNRGDSPCAAAYYSAPSFVVKDGEVTRFGSAEKVAYFTALMEAYVTSGPTASKAGCGISRFGAISCLDDREWRHSK